LRRNTKKIKRITISLGIDDYKSLYRLAAGHSPSLSLNYVVQYAVKELLRKAENPQLELKIVDPTLAKGD